MTLPILFVLGLVLAAAVLFITEKLRPDLIALLVLVALGITNIVKPEELFGGFSRSAVITIIALFIITNGLERTGATRVLGQVLHRLSGGKEARTVLVVMIATAMLSLAMNTIAAAAVLLPVVVGLTRQTGLRASKLLMPLSFGALLGGMATLFTTANILVSSALEHEGLKPYGVLDFIPVGLPMAIAGIVFIVLFGRHFIPDRSRNKAERSGKTLVETYGMNEAIRGAYVKAGSAMAGLSIAEGGWGRKLGLNILGISRGGQIRLAPAHTDEVIEGDVVLFTGFIDDEELAPYGLVLTDDPTWQGKLASTEISLVEVTLAPRSTLAGKTLRDINFREKFDLSVLAIWREGNTFRDALGEINLHFGDALLMQGRRDRMRLLRDDPNFLVLDEDDEGIAEPRKALLAVVLTTLAFVLPAANLLPIAESTFTAACLMVLFQCLSMDDAYSSIEWKSIFLIAGMIPLGLAMTDTGAAALVSQSLVAVLGGWGPLAVAAGLYLIATLLTQVISGQVTPLVLAPIAIAAAQSLGVDPRGLAMAVALGCSTAFLTPISHSANMLVMGPGNYKFGDYARAGLPLTAIMFVVLLIGLYAFWGIR